MQRKVAIGAAEARNEMVFESADGAFGGICAMDARRNELEIHMLFAQKLFERSRAFVVQFLELRAETGVDETIVNGFVCVENGGAALARHGFGVDGIAVIVVQQEQLGVACAGGEDEASGLIGEDLPIGCRWHAGSKAEVSAFAGNWRRRKGIVVLGAVNIGGQ